MGVIVEPISKNVPSVLPGPAQSAAAIDISTVDHVQNFRAIYCGTGGTLVVEPLMADAGVQITFSNVPNAGLIRLAVRRVVKSGTTCAQMVGLM